MSLVVNLEARWSGEDRYVLTYGEVIWDPAAGDLEPSSALRLNPACPAQAVECFGPDGCHLKPALANHISRKVFGSYGCCRKIRATWPQTLLENGNQFQSSDAEPKLWNWLDPHD